MNKDKIMVSIWCIAYNHEKYIAEALESFLNQDTNFKYEIIVHDDASKDKTADIIKNYYNKYPDVIVPLFESENRYSKGEGSYTWCYPKSRGKYIALCEGDDFWIDKNKLQKQVDYMESHSECSLTFHNAVVLNTSKEIIKSSFLPKDKFVAPYYKNFSTEYSVDEMIMLDFAPTNSLMFRYKDVDSFISFMNMRERVCGDLPARLLYSSKGYAYYFAENMSAYRKGVENSASALASHDLYSRIKTLEGHFEILDDFNQLTNNKYAISIGRIKKIKLFVFLMSINSIEIYDKEYKELYKNIEFGNKVKFWIKRFFPKKYKRLKK